ncbi:RNA polymerase sigma factor (sigma-70 family) [Streptomyces sp. SAI-170]|uniref:RNA polymerase sigma factor n=1 Tax=Streptomyces sp. SAI-170 TaxID=3377729 RepID=UPI003C7C16E4
MATTDLPTKAEIQAAHDRWQTMWRHREQLLKVARRRSMSQEDAEDAVHEAMLRAAERPDLDDDRLPAWLTTVTMRLCVDRYRQVSREAEVHRSPTLLAPGPVPVEEAVCDRAEARWLARRSGELPARQAEALRLKSEDLDVSQVAVRMGLSYRTVESLLARARRTLRNSLAGTLGLALFLLGRGRPRPGVVATSAAATLVVAGFALLPHTGPWDRQGTAPSEASVSPAPEAAPRERPYGESAGGTPDVRQAPDARPSSAPRTMARAGEQPLLPLSVPSLAVLSPTAGLPTDEVHEVVPQVPGVPGLPEVPGLSPQGVAPAPPDVPEVPELVDVPTAAEGTQIPDAPAVPESLSDRLP